MGGGGGGEGAHKTCDRGRNEHFVCLFDETRTGEMGTGEEN